MSTLDYRHAAVCRDVDPETFFPLDDRSGSPGVVAAKAVCARCPVRAACLADSLGRGDEFGVFGGLTGRERRALAAIRRETGEAVPEQQVTA